MSLDLGIKDKEVETIRKGKAKVEEDLTDLKQEYKKLRTTARNADLRKTPQQWQQEVQVEEEKARTWQGKFSENQSQLNRAETELARSRVEIEQLRAQLAASVHLRDMTSELQASHTRNELLKKHIQELEIRYRQSRDQLAMLERVLEQGEAQFQDAHHQIQARDQVMGSAIVQIRRVAQHVQNLSASAEIIALNIEPSSDRVQRLAWLLEEIQTLGARARAFL